MKCFSRANCQAESDSASRDGLSKGGSEKLMSRRTFVSYAGASLLMGACGFSAVGCSADESITLGGSHGHGGTDPGQVILSLPSDCEPVAGFDPVRGWGFSGQLHAPLIQSTLFSVQPDGLLAGDLATSCECSDDGMSWSVEIRDDAFFANGERLTADDVAFTINSILQAEEYGDIAQLAFFSEAQACGDVALRLVMKEPNIFALYALAWVGIVPKNGYTKEGYGEDPIGSGMYKLVQWERGQRAVLQFNENYYGSVPSLRTIVVAFMDKERSYDLARKGDIDVAFCPAILYSEDAWGDSGDLRDAAEVKAPPNGYVFRDLSSAGSYRVSLPISSHLGETVFVDKKSGDEKKLLTGNRVTGDLAMRRSIDMALDRGSMNDHVVAGNAVPLHRIGSDLPWSSSSSVLCDRLSACQLLDDSGWGSRFLGSVRDKGGLSASFDLVYSVHDPIAKGLAYECSNQLLSVGIRATPVESSDLNSRVLCDAVLGCIDESNPWVACSILSSAELLNGRLCSLKEVDPLVVSACGSTSLPTAFDGLSRASEGAYGGEPGNSAPDGVPAVWLLRLPHRYIVRERLDMGTPRIQPAGYGWALLDNVAEWCWK